MEDNNNLGGTVSQFYSEKCIFITGATGFMGKMLLNKLLQSCPMLESIYVLIRPKRDELPQVRLDKLLDGPLFKHLEGEEKKSALTNCRFTTISSQISAIYMNIFHKTEVQTVILRC